MVGVTLYVSITTEESVKSDQDIRVMEPGSGYSFYGYSFLCAVLSFVLQELTGVLTVYWFIYRFRALVRKQEKLRERTRQLMGNCLSMTTALPLNFASRSFPRRTRTTTTTPIIRKRIRIIFPIRTTCVTSTSWPMERLVRRIARCPAALPRPTSNDDAYRSIVRRRCSQIRSISPERNSIRHLDHRRCPTETTVEC